MLAIIAEFIGMCVGFYVGAWARVRYTSLAAKAVFFFLGSTVGFLTASIFGIAGVVVIVMFTGAVDFSSGTFDHAAFREAGRTLGANKAEFLAAVATATIAGLVSSLGERFGIGRSRTSKS
jgi:hypothetical protein